MSDDIRKLKRQEAQLWLERKEAVVEAMYRTGFTEAEIELALESQDSVVPDTMGECDPDGSLRLLHKNWKVAADALGKIQRETKR